MVKRVRKSHWSAVISVECYTFKLPNSHMLNLSLYYYLIFLLCLVFVLFLGLKWKYMQILNIGPKKTSKESCGAEELPSDRSQESWIDRSLGSIVAALDRSQSMLPEREKISDSRS
jgi:hypothetical protein